MKILKTDHIVITTKNADACISFYTALGMTAEYNDGRYALHFGESKFNIHTKPAEFLPAAEHPTSGSLDICLETADDIEAVANEVSEKGLETVTGIVSRNGARGAMRSIYLRDPDGNLVEICSYEL